jgi:hypothetical protein
MGKREREREREKKASGLRPGEWLDEKVVDGMESVCGPHRAWAYRLSRGPVVGRVSPRRVVAVRAVKAVKAAPVSPSPAALRLARVVASACGRGGEESNPRAERALAAAIEKAGTHEPVEVAYTEHEDIVDAVQAALEMAEKHGGCSRMLIAKRMQCSPESLANWARRGRSNPIPAWQLARLAGVLIELGQGAAAERLVQPIVGVMNTAEPARVDRAPLSVQGCEISGAAGLVCGEIAEVQRDASPAGQAISPVERERVFERIRALRAEIGQLEDALKAGMPNRK